MTRKEFFSKTLGFLTMVILAAAIALFVNNFFLINAIVPSESMENTIMTGDRVFGVRKPLWFGKPERGDIIVFKYPVNELMKKKLKDAGKEDYAKENDVSSVNYVKRLIGLPGETIEIRNGKIYVDGDSTPLDEPYLKEKWVEENDRYLFEVPEGKYFVLGDNRNISDDARYWSEEALEIADDAGIELTEKELSDVSFVDEDELLGKVNFRYWPLTKASILK